MEKVVRKALTITLSPEKDLGDLVQIARAEGKRLFHGLDVRVVDAVPRMNGVWLVVVQCSEVVSEGKHERV